MEQQHRGAGELPVELVDVLDVAEQRADLLGFQRQGAAVDDAAQVVLQTHREGLSQCFHLLLCTHSDSLLRWWFI